MKRSSLERSFDMKTQRQGLTTKRRKLLGLYLALALLVQLFFSTGAEAAVAA